MDEMQFTVWLKGFIEGTHNFGVTPDKWDLLKDRLASVSKGENRSGYNLGTIEVKSDYWILNAS